MRSRQPIPYLPVGGEPSVVSVQFSLYLSVYRALAGFYTAHSFWILIYMIGQVYVAEYFSQGLNRLTRLRTCECPITAKFTFQLYNEGRIGLGQRGIQCVRDWPDH